MLNKTTAHSQPCSLSTTPCKSTSTIPLFRNTPRTTALLLRCQTLSHQPSNVFTTSLLIVFIPSETTGWPHPQPRFRRPHEYLLFLNLSNYLYHPTSYRNGTPFRLAKLNTIVQLCTTADCCPHLEANCRTTYSTLKLPSCCKHEIVVFYAYAPTIIVHPFPKLRVGPQCVASINPIQCLAYRIILQ